MEPQYVIWMKMEVMWLKLVTHPDAYLRSAL